jgi:hypothetical protein
VNWTIESIVTMTVAPLEVWLQRRENEHQARERVKGGSYGSGG